MSKFYFIALGMMLSIMLSCSTQQVLLNPREFHTNQTINIKTIDGQTISGIVVLANADALLLRDAEGKNHAYLTKNIVSAKGPNPVLDDNGILVSEADIDSVKTSAHLTTYAIVGGLMSGGVSFLFSRMINNEMLGSSDVEPLYIATVSGMSLGTILFARAGNRKDREKAIDNVLSARSDAKYNVSLPDLEDDKFLKEKINEITKERQQKEKEIEQLSRELQKQQETNTEPDEMNSDRL